MHDESVFAQYLSSGKFVEENARNFMMLASPLTRESTERRNGNQFVYIGEPASRRPLHSKDMNRLLTAAVVNHKFCNLLLNDPLDAIAKGYNGETFEMDEYFFADV